MNRKITGLILVVLAMFTGCSQNAPPNDANTSDVGTDTGAICPNAPVHMNEPCTMEQIPLSCPSDPASGCTPSERLYCTCNGTNWICTLNCDAGTDSGG